VPGVVAGAAVGLAIGAAVGLPAGALVGVDGTSVGLGAFVGVGGTGVGVGVAPHPTMVVAIRATTTSNETILMEIPPSQ